MVSLSSTTFLIPLQLQHSSTLLSYFYGITHYTVVILSPLLSCLLAIPFFLLSYYPTCYSTTNCGYADSAVPLWNNGIHCLRMRGSPGFSEEVGNYCDARPYITELRESLHVHTALFVQQSCALGEVGKPRIA